MSDTPPIQILRTDTLHESAKLRVVVDHQQLPDGTVVAWESVVHLDAVLALPIDADGSAYLVEQYRPQLKQRTVEVVGGGRELGMTPEEAMHRELLEEAGIVASLRSLGTAQLGASTIRCRAHLFLAHVERVQPPEPEPFERLMGHRVLRVPLAEAVELAMSGAMVDSTSRLLVLLAAEHVRRELPSR